MGLSSKPVTGTRPFVISPYNSDKSGRLVPLRPDKCTKAVAGAGGECLIRIAKWRSRACGPIFALAVGRCRSHICDFTIYPLGWTPYGRRPLVDLASDGEPRVEDESVPWQESEFMASVDAEQKSKWPETGKQSRANGGYFRTQQRHVSGACALFTINIDATKSAREISAATLGVGLAHFEQSVRRIRARDGPLWQSRGREGMAILSEFKPKRDTYVKLLALGQKQKYWGTPYFIGHSLTEGYVSTNYVS